MMTKARGVVMVGALIVTTACAGAPKGRELAACPPVTGDVYHGCQLDSQPQRLPDTLPPIYSHRLMVTGMGGTVRVAYTIDTAGHAVQPFEIRQASHELLAAAADGAIVRSRFSPGARAGQPVAVRYEEVFEFVPDETNTPPVDVVIVRRDSTPDGVPRTVIGRVPRDPSAAGKVKGADLREAQRTALAAVALKTPTTPGTDVIVCVQFNTGKRNVPADEETIRRVSAPGLRAVHPRDCPPTHNLTLPKRDSTGRVIEPPLGWIDPYWVTMIGTGVWTRDIVRVNAQLWHSDSTTFHLCVARRSGAAWSATCDGRTGTYIGGIPEGAQ